MIHICLKDMKPHFYAPDVNICETVDHFIKKPDPDSPSRNALVEAARIARSDIKPLCQCQACKHEALVIPGGFGAAKTLLVICCVDSDLKKRLNETNNFVGNFTFEKKQNLRIKFKVLTYSFVLQNQSLSIIVFVFILSYSFAGAISQRKVPIALYIPIWNKLSRISITRANQLHRSASLVFSQRECSRVLKLHLGKNVSVVNENFFLS